MSPGNQIQAAVVGRPPEARRTFLVTGAAGGLGAEVCARLVARGLPVIGLLHQARSRPQRRQGPVPRHGLTVAEREHPRVHSRLTWPDRAWLALLAGTLPIGRIAMVRLAVTPGTILRWHRDIGINTADRDPSHQPAVRALVQPCLRRLARRHGSHRRATAMSDSAERAGLTRRGLLAEAGAVGAGLAAAAVLKGTSRWPSLR